MTFNNKSYGDQCKCTHVESDHRSVKKRASIESVTQDYTMMIPPAEWPAEFSRGSCKICKCTNFEPIKKKKKRWKGLF